MLKIVNQTVPLALAALGYTPAEIESIIAWIDEHDTIEGAADLKSEHLPIFDCAFQPRNGTRSIAWKAHVLMMAAAQPFLSGAISKTVNMPKETTPDDIADAYREGWRLGLKALAVYRDGSKETQPLSTRSSQTEKSIPKPRRERLLDTRQSITHKFSVAGHEGYITVGLYPDGRPGELFITMAKEGSTIGGLMDCFGTAVSMSLQYGVPLEVYVNKFSHTRFEPLGHTKNPDIRFAKSIVDYIFRWLGITFIPGYKEMNSNLAALHPEGGFLSGETGKAASGETEGELGPAATKAGGPNAGPGGAKSNGTASTYGASPPRLAGGSPRASILARERPAAAASPAALKSRSEQFATFQADAPPCDSCGAITVRNGNCYLCHNCGNSMGCS
jgi:ribonucleoside-diphosphate reductase alpha chain